MSGARWLERIHGEMVLGNADKKGRVSQTALWELSKGSTSDLCSGIIRLSIVQRVRNREDPVDWEHDQEAVTGNPGKADKTSVFSCVSENPEEKVAVGGTATGLYSSQPILFCCLPIHHISLKLSASAIGWIVRLLTKTRAKKKHRCGGGKWRVASETLKLSCLQGSLIRGTEPRRDMRSACVNLESLKKKK